MAPNGLLPTRPKAGSKSSTPSSLLTTFLTTNPAISFIRFQFIDICGVVRCFIVPTAYAAELAAKHDGGSLNIVSPITSLLIPGDIAAVDVVTVGDDKLRADWDTLRPCGYH